MEIHSNRSKPKLMPPRNGCNTKGYHVPAQNSDPLLCRSESYNGAIVEKSASDARGGRCFTLLYACVCICVAVTTKLVIPEEKGVP